MMQPVMVIMDMAIRVRFSGGAIGRSGLTVVVGLSICLHGNHAQALETEVGLMLKHAYLENDIGVTSETGQATTIAPGIMLNKPEGRLQFEIDYRLDAIFYNGLNESDREDHNLRLSSRLVHDPSNWYSQLNGNISRYTLDPNGIQSTNPLFGAANSRELQTLGFSSHYTNQLTRRISLAMDVGVNRSDYEQEAATDGTEIGIVAASKSGWSHLDWSASARRQENRDSATRLAVDNVAVSLGYGWTREIRTFAELARTETSSSNIESDSALLGIEFRPGLRSMIKIGAGERDNSESYFLDIQHRKRHVQMFARYDERIITPRQQTLENLNNDTVFQTSFQEVSIEPVLQKRGDLGLTYQGVRSELGFSWFESTRQQPGINVETRQTGGSVKFSRQLASQSSLDLFISRQNTRQVQTNKLDDVSIALNRQLGKSVEARVQLSYSKQSSDDVLSTYRHDSFYVSVNMHL
jgi:hypothetical protein